MPSVEIYVSHRRDKKTFKPESKVFKNVVCGSAICNDEGRFEGYLRDDAGENVSFMAGKLSELSVLYWAWKNSTSDFIGLCHYRRFLSFEDPKFLKEIRKNEFDQYVMENLSQNSIDKFHIGDDEKIEKILDSYDAVIANPIDIKKVQCCNNGKFETTLREHWRNYDNYLLKPETISKLLSTINDLFPDKLKIVEKYLNGDKYIGFNCFILRREVLDELCNFIFPILFKLDGELDYRNNHCRTIRSLGYVGEILIGSFLLNRLERNKNKIYTTNVVFFENTEEKKYIKREEKTSIPIVLMSSDYYIPYVSTLLQSLFESKAVGTKYDVIILNKWVSPENKRRLEQQCQNLKGISLRFYNPTFLFDDSKFFVSNTVYAVEAYYRMFSPWLLPDYDKAIVMDSDIIINGDLSDLYDISLEGKLAAAVKDFVYQGFLNENLNNDIEYATETIGLENPYDYVNTGVLLLNLKELRNQFSLNYLVELATTKKFRIQEQDILNFLLQKKVIFLDIKWNYYLEVNGAIARFLESSPEASYNTYQSCKDPVILHYASQPKPWDCLEVKFSDEFWLMARKTYFYEILLQRLMMRQFQPAVNDLSSKMFLISTAKEQTMIRNREKVRHILDLTFPRGSYRRECLKRVFRNKGSRFYKLTRGIYRKVLSLY